MGHPNLGVFVDLMKLALGAEARKLRQVPSGDTDGNSLIFACSRFDVL